MITEKDGWLTDANNNRASISYFGSRKLAEKALLSLKNCDNCTNCSGCSDCSGCSRCSRCSDCSDCSGCSRCSRCSDCSGCSGCSDCSGCSRCSRCSDCSGCSGCSRCSRCSDCSDCSGCSDCSLLYDKHSYAAAPRELAVESETFGVPPVPVIPDIHQAVYAAASQPKALDMSSWHACETVHCRAGWVVHLAGDEGRKLEEFHNTELAAMLIYKASGAPINPARFHDSNEVAMADMKRLAEAESTPTNAEKD